MGASQQFRSGQVSAPPLTSQPASAHPSHLPGREPTFHSILFERPENRGEERREPPAFFADLNLDQIVDTITAGKEEYDLRPFFYAPLNTVNAIQYRHQVMQDLEDGALLRCIHSWAQRMRAMRDRLAKADKLYYNRQREALFLDAVACYCDAVTSLAADLAHIDVKSQGFLAFRDYLGSYAESRRFTSLLAETQGIQRDLSAIRYCVLINGDAVTVRKYDGETDYSSDVLDTFERFKQGAVKDYAVKFPTELAMNHIEAQILEFVAQLFPEVFRRLAQFCAAHSDFQDDGIRAFDREIQFYVAYLEYVERFREAGLHVCYPRVSTRKRVYDYEGYDFALAQKLLADKSSVVPNDFDLRDPERILVVSGPNQGGKTTFARTFGQLHYLARLGCPIAGREAQTFLFDNLFTHFEREEDVKNLRGKLEDDLVRIHDILTRATPDSIIIMNEIFTSTALKDAIFLSRKIMETIMGLDLLCVWVTFIDELASVSEKTVSLVSTVVPDNPAVRTYRILRRPADGLAYAISIAEKHRVTYKDLRERLTS
jgi:DNA mismatch repair protein MutS